jgi:hypothetical protein
MNAKSIWNFSGNPLLSCSLFHNGMFELSFVLFWQWITRYTYVDLKVKLLKRVVHYLVHKERQLPWCL